MLNEGSIDENELSNLFFNIPTDQQLLPKLKRLIIENQPQLKEFNLSAPQLERISLSNCQQLARVTCHASNLKFLDIQGTRNLIELKIPHHQLETLLLNESSITENELSNLFFNIPTNQQLPHILSLQNCPQFSHLAFREKYPQLGVLPLNKFTNDSIYLLDKVFTEIFSTYQYTWSDIPSQSVSQIFNFLKMKLKILNFQFSLLQDKESRVRSAAADALGQLGQGTADVITALLSLLQDEGFWVRRAAADALGKLGQGNAEVITALLSLLQDEEFWVRSAVANTLGKLGQGTADVITALLSLLQDEWPEVRRAAADALGQLGQGTADVITALLSLLQDKWFPMRNAAVSALGKLGQGNAEVITALLDLLQDKESRVRSAAASALGQLGQGNADVITALLSLLQDEWPEVRLAAASALDQLGQGNAEVITALLSLLQDKDSWVRRTAASALGKLGQGNADVITALLSLLQDKDSWMRRTAASALGKLGQGNADVITALLSLLQDEWLEVRSAAADALGQLGQGTAEVITALLSLLQDEWLEVRSAAADALGQLGQGTAEVITALLSLLQDKDSSVGHTAADALVQLGQGNAEVITALLSLLQDKDSKVYSAAASALGRLGQGTAEVITALLSLLQDKDSWVRIAAADALGKLGQGNADVITALLSLLQDKDSWVRRTAADALGQLGQGTAEVITALLSLLQDEWPEIRRAAASAAASALGQLSQGNAEVITALLSLLQDKDSWVRRTAASALVQLGQGTAEVITALLSLLQDEWPEIRRAAASALGQLSQGNAEVITALLSLLQDKDSCVRHTAASALVQLGQGTAEVITALLSLLQREPELANLFSNNNTILQLKTILSKAIKPISSQNKCATSLSNKKISDSVVHKINSHNSVNEKTNFSTIKQNSVLESNNQRVANSFTKQNSHTFFKAPPDENKVISIETLGDGNCCFNAVSLGLCDLVITDQTIKNWEKCGKAIQQACQLSDSKIATFKDWLISHWDNRESRQAIFAPILRHLALQHIEKNYAMYSEEYEAQLEGAYFGYKNNENFDDDTFRVHPHILTIFNKLKDKRDTDEQEKILLRQWWAQEGKDDYFSTLKTSAENALDKKRWGGQIEIAALAIIFGINIQWCKGSGRETVGVGGGQIDNLSAIQEKQLRDLGIGNSYLGSFRIDNYKDTESLHLDLTAVERTLMQKINDLIKFAKTQPNNELSPSQISTILMNDYENCFDILKRRNILTRKNNNYVFIKRDNEQEGIDEEAIQIRLKGVDNTLRDKVLAAFKQDVPIFAVENQGIHWTYNRSISLNQQIENKLKTSSPSTQTTLPVSQKFGSNRDEENESANAIQLIIMQNRLSDLEAVEKKRVLNTHEKQEFDNLRENIKKIASEIKEGISLPNQKMH